MWTSALVLFLFTLNLHAKVEAPNYNFSIDTLSNFFPGKKISEVPKELGEGQIIQNGAVIKKKFYVSYLRYKFPVIISIYQETILDMYATLPSYFLHDVFHQSLINRFGKQDKFLSYNGTSLYEWNNKNSMNLVYSSTCTITCFPLYFSASITESPYRGFTPMIESLSEGHL